MKKRIIFLVNGIGLGNSTRCYAVIQHLMDRETEIEVVTSDNGLWFFRSRTEVKTLHQIESLYYGKENSRLSIRRTLASLRDFKAIMVRNADHIENIIQDFRPHVAVIDSVYTFIPFKKAGIPIVALNNSDVICKSYYRFKDKPVSIRPQFYAVELMDYYFHRFIPNLVISPTFDQTVRQSCGKFQRVGPIVRKNFIPTTFKKKPERAVIMLSGSTFGSPVTLKRTNYTIHIDIVGRDAPPTLNVQDNNIVYQGKLLDSFPLLYNADIAVVNGGFSAVSEMVYMNKPMVVIPVPHHAEQWLNARTIEYLGVGIMADEDNFEDKMVEVIQEVEKFHEAYRKLPEVKNGAEDAAEMILRAVG